MPLVRLLHDVSVTCHTAPSTNAAFQGVLETVCAHERWQVGHVYQLRRRPRRMVSTGLWHADPALDLEPFVRATLRAVFSPGQGVVGRVASSGEPVWVSDLRKEPQWMREGVSEALQSAALFPVLVEGEVVAVLEFFSTTGIEPREGFLRGMRSVGIQLGHVVERRDLERRVAGAAAAEQSRLGRELHDSLGQQIAGIGMMADSLARRLAAHDGPEAELARELADCVADAKRQTSALAKGLMPVELDPNGLMQALEARAAGSEVMYDISCALRCECAVAISDAETATHLYRIAQESVHNAVAHGRAKRVEIVLRNDPRAVSLEVRDDGVGIPDRVPRGRGAGLRIMRYRAGVIGAELAIARREKAGTRVRVTLPI